MHSHALCSAAQSVNRRALLSEWSTEEHKALSGINIPGRSTIVLPSLHEHSVHKRACACQKNERKNNTSCKRYVVLQCLLGCNGRTSDDDMYLTTYLRDAVSRQEHPGNSHYQ